jgi:hypothetical protein
MIAGRHWQEIARGAELQPFDDSEIIDVDIDRWCIRRGMDDAHASSAFGSGDNGRLLRPDDADWPGHHQRQHRNERDQRPEDPSLNQTIRAQ